MNINQEILNEIFSLKIKGYLHIEIREKLNISQWDYYYYINSSDYEFKMNSYKQESLENTTILIYKLLPNLTKQLIKIINTNSDNKDKLQAINLLLKLMSDDRENMINNINKLLSIIKDDDSLGVNKLYDYLTDGGKNIRIKK